MQSIKTKYLKFTIDLDFVGEVDDENYLGYMSVDADYNDEVSQFFAAVHEGLILSKAKELFPKGNVRAEDAVVLFEITDENDKVLFLDLIEYAKELEDNFSKKVLR